MQKKKNPTEREAARESTQDTSEKVLEIQVQGEDWAQCPAGSGYLPPTECLCISLKDAVSPADTAHSSHCLSC